MTQPPPPPGPGWPPGYPGGQPGPQWNPQQGWPQTPPPPPKRSFAKWIIGAVALIAVIAVTAVIAVSCTKSSGGTEKPTAAPTTSGAPASDFASANDTGPVSVITEDPSCAPWMPILTTYANSQPSGWLQRDSSLPADVWGPELRSQYEAVGKAMRAAADQTVPLVKLTTHRVMRELYEQFIAYARAYADRIPLYTAPDDQLALTAIGASQVLSHICQAITYGSAAARAPLTAMAQPPTSVAPLGSPNKPARFLSQPNPVCSDWKAALDRNDTNPAIVAWVATDSNPPASQWSPEQKAANDAVLPLLTSLADELDKLGRTSGNAIFEDLATLSAQYQRAFVNAIPTYTQPDLHLYKVALLTPGIVLGACNTAGS